MPLILNGTGTIAGLTAGGLPNSSVITATINDAAVTPVKLSQALTLGSVQNTASGATVIDLSTNIPSWVKRITVMLNGVSTSGSSLIAVQLGTSSGLVTTGYTGYTWTGNTNNTSHSYGFNITAVGYNSTHTVYGHALLTNISGNTWIFSTTSGLVAGNTANCGGGSISLSGALTTVRLTTSSADTFDAGTASLMYE